MSGSDFKLTLQQSLESFLVLWWNPKLIWLPMLRSDPKCLHYECQPLGFCRFWGRIAPTSLWQLRGKESKFILGRSRSNRDRLEWCSRTTVETGLYHWWGGLGSFLEYSRAALICIPSGERIFQFTEFYGYMLNWNIDDKSILVFVYVSGGLFERISSPKQFSLSSTWWFSHFSMKSITSSWLMSTDQIFACYKNRLE